MSQPTIKRRWGKRWGGELKQYQIRLPIRHIETLNQIAVATGKAKAEIIRILIEDLGSEEIAIIVKNHNRER